MAGSASGGFSGRTSGSGKVTSSSALTGGGAVGAGGGAGAACSGVVFTGADGIPSVMTRSRSEKSISSTRGSGRSVSGNSSSARSVRSGSSITNVSALDADSSRCFTRASAFETISISSFHSPEADSFASGSADVTIVISGSSRVGSAVFFGFTVFFGISISGGSIVSGFAGSTAGRAISTGIDSANLTSGAGSARDSTAIGPEDNCSAPCPEVEGIPSRPYRATSASRVLNFFSSCFKHRAATSLTRLSGSLSPRFTRGITVSSPISVRAYTALALMRGEPEPSIPLRVEIISSRPNFHNALAALARTRLSGSFRNGTTSRTILGCPIRPRASTALARTRELSS